LLEVHLRPPAPVGWHQRRIRPPYASSKRVCDSMLNRPPSVSLPVDGSRHAIQPEIARFFAAKALASCDRRSTVLCFLPPTLCVLDWESPDRSLNTSDALCRSMAPYRGFRSLDTIHPRHPKIPLATALGPTIQPGLPTLTTGLGSLARSTQSTFD
jgi:hypothetical protein